MSVAGSVISVVRRHFISGMLVVVPLILTFIVLRFLFEAVDGVLKPILEDLLGYYRTGFGVLTTILLILLAGILTANFLGRRLYKLGDQVMIRVPLVRPIYSASKQLLEGMTGAGGASFKEVALIEYPRLGLYSLCFIAQRTTIRIKGETRQFATCFVPSTPTPVSGMAVIVPVDQVISVDMTVEEGVKFVVSGGAATPATIGPRIAASKATSEEER